MATGKQASALLALTLLASQAQVLVLANVPEDQSLQVMPSPGMHHLHLLTWTCDTPSAHHSSSGTHVTGMDR
jgi:hypothetical protein